MKLINEEQARSINILIPFALAGLTFYQGYAKKGKTDYKSAFMMSAIIFIFSLVVTSQATKIIS